MHKPIVTSEQYIKAQSLLNAKEPSHTKRSQKSFLAGLLKCEECGFSFGLKSTAKGGKDYAYYYCRSRHSRGLCQNGIYISANELEQVVINDCIKHLDDFLESDLKNAKNKQIVFSKEDEIQAQIDNIISNIGKGNAVVDNLLTTKITALQNQLNEMKADRAKQYTNISYDDLKTMKQQLGAFERLTMNAKISLIRNIVKTVKISKP